MSLKHSLLKVVLGLSIVASSAQEQKNTITTAGDTMTIGWDSVAARTYFVQYSEDLQSWHFFPVIYSGNGQAMTHSAVSYDDKYFLRLNYTDMVTSDPQGDDFDADGVSNWDEIRVGGLGTNPLVFSTAGDGTADAQADSDQDGLKNISELTQQSDPQWADHPAVMLSVYAL